MKQFSIFASAFFCTSLAVLPSVAEQYEIRGKVTDSSNLPIVATVTVGARDDTSSGQQTVRTSTNGIYAVQLGLARDTSIVVMASEWGGYSWAREIVLGNSTLITNVDFIVPPMDTNRVSIAGTLTVDGRTPSQYAAVVARRRDPINGQFFFAGQVVVIPDFTNNNSYALNDLPVGVYDLTASADSAGPTQTAITVTAPASTIHMNFNFTTNQVRDTSAPVITIVGSNPATAECHTEYSDAGATAIDDQAGNLTSAIVISNAINPALVGTYTVTYTVSDPSGNRATATRTVNVVDTTPPQITCPGNMSVGCSTNLDTPVSFTVTAVDVCDPQPVIASTPASGTGFKVGATTVTCTARDAAGNTNTCSFTITRVALGFTGFLAPVSGADATGGDYAHPLRTFKLKSTVPVKFTASCAGNAVTAGVHTLQVIKYSNETTAADPLDATPTDAATTGNQFRLTTGEWHFNLDTKATGMTAGTWLLRATLSDGSVHSAWIALK